MPEQNDAADSRPILGADDPLTLSEACEIIFKNKIKPATLRKLALKGDLVIEKIGRRHFVTPAAIKEMRERCRVGGPQKAPSSGLSQNESMPADDPSAALASFRKSAAELSKRFEKR